MLNGITIRTLIFTGLIFSLHALPAQETSPFEDFFDREEPLEITLEFDLKNLQRTREEEQYQPALLTVENYDGDHTYPVRIRTRGTLRKSFCNIPPFWINIRNSGIIDESIVGVRKFKVVNHCMKSAVYQDYILKEYLAYKIYQLLTPYSFKVRLLKITYIDTGRNHKTTTGWGFIIEPEELLAQRLDAVLIENDKLAMANMNSMVMDRLSMYYYMTGNTDFSITGRHNVKIIRLNKPGDFGYIPIPYDFDFSGFVNAQYAVPSSTVPIEKVTDRYFVGICRSKPVHQQVVNEYHDLSADIHQLLQSFEHIHLDEKMDMLRFIEEFFTEISQENFIGNKISNSCK